MRMRHAGISDESRARDRELVFPEGSYSARSIKDARSHLDEKMMISAFRSLSTLIERAAIGGEGELFFRPYDRHPPPRGAPPGKG